MNANVPVPGWHGLGHEDRVILAGMRIKQDVDAEFRADMDRVNGTTDGTPERRVEAGKFLVKWQERIAQFARSHRSGAAYPGRRMTIEEARSRIPWLSRMDVQHWRGGLFEYLRDNLTPVEMAMIVERMEALNNLPREKGHFEIMEQLEENKNNFMATAGIVGSEMRDFTRRYTGKILGEAQGRYTAQFLSRAKAQLDALAASPASAPSIIDGQVRTEPVPPVRTDPVVVPPVVPGADDTRRIAAARLAPATRRDTDPDGDRLTRHVPPGPRSDTDIAPTLGPSVRNVATFPPVLGAMLGAVAGMALGFLLLGPLGALLGLVVGGAAGVLAGRRFT